MPANENERILKEAAEYNDQHTVNTVVDVMTDDSYTLSHPYDAILNPSGNGVMGYLEIPKIAQSLVIFHGTGSESLDKGIGHVEGTSLPIGGIGSHTVLAGHRGLQNAKIFTDLDQLSEGDLFYLHILEDTLCYEIFQIAVVLPDESDCLAIRDGMDLATLLTCTPYGVNSHRLLVTGKRIPFDETAKMEEFDKRNVFDLMDTSLKALIAAIILMTAVTIRMFNRRRRSGRQSDRGL